MSCASGTLSEFICCSRQHLFLFFITNLMHILNASVACRFDPPQRLALQRDALRTRLPLRVHLPQQTVSLIVRHHELLCIYLLPAWHADCYPPQRLASQRDVLRTRLPSQSSSAAADGCSYSSSSQTRIYVFMPAWHADRNSTQRLASHRDVLCIRPSQRLRCRSRQLFHLLLFITYIFMHIF